MLPSPPALMFVPSTSFVAVQLTQQWCWSARKALRFPSASVDWRIGYSNWVDWRFGYHNWVDWRIGNSNRVDWRITGGGFIWYTNLEKSFTLTVGSNCLFFKTLKISISQHITVDPRILWATRMTIIGICWGHIQMKEYEAWLKRFIPGFCFRLQRLPIKSTTIPFLSQ